MRRQRGRLSGARGQRSLRSLIKGKLRIRKKGGEQAREGSPLQGAAAGGPAPSGLQTHAGPPPPQPPGRAGPRPGPRCERGTKARERGSQRGVGPGGFPAVPRGLPLSPTHFRERRPARPRPRRFLCSRPCRDQTRAKRPRAASRRSACAWPCGSQARVIFPRSPGDAVGSGNAAEQLGLPLRLRLSLSGCGGEEGGNEEGCYFGFPVPLPRNKKVIGSMGRKNREWQPGK